MHQKLGSVRWKRSVFTPLQCKVGVQGIVCKLLRTRLILGVLGSMFPVPAALRAKLAFMVPFQWMYGRCGCANPSPLILRPPTPLIFNTPHCGNIYIYRELLI